VIAVLTIAVISGTSIEPEARRRVYWTNVSTNTKVGSALGCQLSAVSFSANGVYCLLVSTGIPSEAVF
jgi:hypothetical protein